MLVLTQVARSLLLFFFPAAAPFKSQNRLYVCVCSLRVIFGKSSSSCKQLERGEETKMQSAKDTASNVAASAKSGMDKTKAVVEEKAEKMTTRDPVKKEMAEQKKEARINEAERMKHETRAENAAARLEHGHGHGLGYTATGTDTTGYSTGMTDRPAGYKATEGAVGSQYPAGTTTGTGRTGLQDPRVAGGKSSTGYGSGGTI